MMKSNYRTTVAGYVAAKRHLREDGSGPKTLSQMAMEIGATSSTVRRWLRQDHWELWMEYWPSVGEIFDELRREREQEWERLPEQERQARQLAKEQSAKAMWAKLEEDIADLMRGDHQFD